MISAQWYKVIYDLWGDKTRTILNVMSISVGLFAIGTILSSRVILATDLLRSYRAINPSTGTITTYQTFNDDLVETVKSMKDVLFADAKKSFIARIQTKSSEWKSLNLIAYKDFDEIDVNVIKLEEGEFYPEKHEMLLERSSLSYLGLEIGDTVRIMTNDDKDVTLRIVGSIHDLTAAPAKVTGSPTAYVSEETAEWLGEQPGYNQLDIVARNGDDRKISQNILNDVVDKVESAGIIIGMSQRQDPGKVPLNDVLQAILMLMGILGGLTLFLSIFLIINTVTSLLAEQMRQIGIMKAIGGSTRQILSMYLAMVTVYGVLALIIALPAGKFGAIGLSQFMANLFNFDVREVQIPASTYIIQIVIGLFLPIVSSLAPFITGLRISAAEAMSTLGTTPSSTGNSFIDKLFSGMNLWATRRIITRPMILSLRNTFRRKGRLVLTLITLSLAGVIFITVFNAQRSLNATIDDLMEGRAMDIIVVFTKSYRSERMIEQARKVPGVVEAETGVQISARRIRPNGDESPSITMQGMELGSKIFGAPKLLEGRWLTDEDHNAVVVNSYMISDEAENGAPIKVGDQITLKINGRKSKWTIIGVSLGTQSSMMITDYASGSKVSGNIGKSQVLFLNTTQHDKAFAKQVAKDVEVFFKNANVDVMTVMTIKEFRDQMSSTFNIIIYLLVFMAGLLAVVGGLGLMGTMSINVIERTREIGVMRAIGSPDREVSTVFTIEGFIISAISWVIGVGLSYPFTNLVVKLLGDLMLKYPLKAAYSNFGILFWLLLIVLLSTLANYLPAKNATKLTVREILAYE